MFFKRSDFNSSDFLHDPENPSAWNALFLDRSIPMSDDIKTMWLKNSSSWSRQYFLPIARGLARLLTFFIQALKIILPFDWHAPYFMHRCLVMGLKTFVSPEANLFILRHFNLGSEVLGFLATNIEGIEVTTSPLRPLKIEDVADNLFVKHDINLFNFVINVNKELRQKGLEIKPQAKLNFQMMGQPQPALSDMPNGFLNFMDLESAIELFAPLYQLFLTDKEFWRATHSLQLDETVGIYASKILKKQEWLFLIANRHPLVPVSTHEAAHRLVLHGLGTEILHQVITLEAQAQGRLNDSARN